VMVQGGCQEGRGEGKNKRQKPSLRDPHRRDCYTQREREKGKRKKRKRIRPHAVSGSSVPARLRREKGRRGSGGHLYKGQSSNCHFNLLVAVEGGGEGGKERGCARKRVCFHLYAKHMWGEKKGKKGEKKRKLTEHQSAILSVANCHGGRGERGREGRNRKRTGTPNLYLGSGSEGGGREGRGLRSVLKLLFLTELMRTMKKGGGEKRRRGGGEKREIRSPFYNTF